MAKLNIKSVTYNIEKRFPSYVVAAVVDCDYGYEGVKLITEPEELDEYYSGIKNREGLIQLLGAGASLYLTRLDRDDTRTSTLRLLNNGFKYCHPLNYDNIDYGDREPLYLEPTLSPENISLHKTHTYSYVIDFGFSGMNDEDFIAIPSYFSEDPEYDNSILFYFTNLNPEDYNRKYPNDFSPSVPLSTLGNKSVGIDIVNVDPKDRAKIIYEWYLGTIEPDPTKYDIVGSPGDSNLIPEFSVLDESRNKVTLVFTKPIRNIKYYNSNSGIKFLANSDSELNQELIAFHSKDESIISFSSKIQGDIELNISFRYITDFEFELDISSGNDNEYHYVSIDKDAPLYQGQSLYIEDVLERESNLVNCTVHLGGRIYSEDSDKFTQQEAKNLEGFYKVSYGKKGLNVPKTVGNSFSYPFQRSLDKLIDADIIPNLFLFEENVKKEFQYDCYKRYLYDNSIIGIVNIPNINYISEGSFKESLDKYLLKDSDRELILYTYGRFVLNDTIVDNSYLYSINSISGNFKNSIIEGALPENINSEVYPILDEYSINYLDQTKEYYFINTIVNLKTFIDPRYSLIANYVKVYMTRFLKNKLGLYPEELSRLINIEISKVSGYSNSIESLTVSRFTSSSNSLNLSMNLELRGLIGRSLDVIIKINK